MTTIDTTHSAPAAHSESATSGAATSGLMSIAEWATTVDHKKIGRLFIGVAFLEVLLVAGMGAVLGIERMNDAAATTFNADALLQLFQGFRVWLVLAVAAPMALGLSIAVAPIQVGARTMAFPRVALTGFYLWLMGGGLSFAALLGNGGFGGGNADMADLFLISVGVAMSGLLLGAVAVGTTVMATRAPGMTLGRVPIFAWSALVGSISMLLMLPVAIGLVILTFVDHRYGDNMVFGGSEGIALWLEWIWSTPAVLVFTIPAFGVFAELVPVTFRTPGSVPGIRRASIALIGVVSLAALTQQHSFPLTFGGNQTFGDVVGSVIVFGLMVGLPLIGLFGSGLTGFLTVMRGAKQGRPAMNAPFVFGMFALILLIAAFIGNAMMSITNFDLVGTAFAEGVVILATYGTVMGVAAGVVFWAPKLTGKLVSAAKVLPLALLMLIGGALAGAGMLIAGAVGQAGSTPNNDAAVAALLDLSSSASIWNLLAVIGHGVFAVGVLLFIGAMLQTRAPKDEHVAENPYGGFTVEWTAPSPAPEHNFEYVPTVSSATPAFLPNAAIVVSEGSES